MALHLYEQMQEEGVNSNDRTYVSVFQACGTSADKEACGFVDGHSAKLKAFVKGQAIHAVAMEKGYDTDEFVGSSLINMYGRCGTVMCAQNVFDGLVRRDVVSWNAIIAAYIEQGEEEKCLQLYEQMWEQSVSPNAWTFVSVLQACGMMVDKVGDQVFKCIGIGKALHAGVQRKGFEADVFVGSTLISMYGKCGSILDAAKVFGGLVDRNVVSWNAMLAAYVEQGEAEKALEFYDHMLRESVPDKRTFSSAIQACTMLANVENKLSTCSQFFNVKPLDKGKSIHADMRRKGVDGDAFVCSTLIYMYGRCGSIMDAWDVFDELPQRDLVVWNAMLKALIEDGQAGTALQLYKRMEMEGIDRDERTYAIALQACGMLAQQEEECGSDAQSSSLKFAEIGRAIHTDAHRNGFDTGVFVGSSLIIMYRKIGDIADARKAFDALPHRDVIVWTAMLGAYVEQGQADLVLQLYEQMKEEYVKPDAWTFVTLLQACAILVDEEEEAFVDGHPIKVRYLDKGKGIHKEAQGKGFDSNVFVASTLISMYGKCGNILDAEKVFNCLSDHSVVAWTAMLGAYAEHSKADKALHLYRVMQQNGPSPNEITIVCILQGPSKTGSLTILREIHQALVPSTNLLSPLLASALISAYGRCASMSDAQAVFDALAHPDVISWNALIAAYARQGCSEECLGCYVKMQLACVKPTGLTFLSLLSACSNAGLVDRGIDYFECMTKVHALSPEIEHYVCMTDLLGRAGFFAMVEGLLSTMPMQANLSIWLCLLGACRKHGRVAIGEQAFNYAVRLEPIHGAAYILMVNIYVNAGLLDRANEVAKLRQENGAWRKPGQSWIDHKQGLQTFVVADRRHPQHVQVYELLRKVGSELKEIHVVFDNLDETADHCSLSGSRQDQSIMVSDDYCLN
eukprot:TRINITY_DN2236_c0_g2_i1.p1 TRINITY_DN2236_c0_g2~~TRINITY_DN2236_c0_g2_i1.p1  ORF type:complete len:930 (+),score=210.17 TRINITY_DN2236_c0_g2_i1:66-2792(+)